VSPTPFILRSNKYGKVYEGYQIDAQALSGDYYLEIPSSNRAFYESSTIHQELAETHGIQVIFLGE
jgi:hypothetical protein